MPTVRPSECAVGLLLLRMSIKRPRSLLLLVFDNPLVAGVLACLWVCEQLVEGA